MKSEILIVDRDPRQREGLCALLTAVGLDVRGFGSLDELDAGMRHAVMPESDEDLIAGDGPSAHATPMGFLLLSNGDAVRDFFVKPLDLRVLQNVCEQQAMPEEAEADASGEAWVYDATRWTLKAPNGRSVQLKMIEARVVHCLLLRVGEIATREEILKFLQRPNLEALARNLDVTVSRLRKKVELMCWRKLPATSARGHGYVFNGSGAIVN